MMKRKIILSTNKYIRNKLKIKKKIVYIKKLVY